FIFLVQNLDQSIGIRKTCGVRSQNNTHRLRSRIQKQDVFCNSWCCIDQQIIKHVRQCRDRLHHGSSFKVIHVIELNHTTATWNQEHIFRNFGQNISHLFATCDDIVNISLGTNTEKNIYVGHAKITIKNQNLFTSLCQSQRQVRNQSCF